MERSCCWHTSPWTVNGEHFFLFCHRLDPRKFFSNNEASYLKEHLAEKKWSLSFFPQGNWEGDLNLAAVVASSSFQLDLCLLLHIYSIPLFNTKRWRKREREKAGLVGSVAWIRSERTEGDVSSLSSCFPSLNSPLVIYDCSQGTSWTFSFWIHAYS